jgi:hypothetical protein
MILFLKFRQKAKTVFLDKEYSITVDPAQKYHIVLSPSLYWIKKVSLPVKYLHEVNKLAPTLFEETLPEGKYNYYAYKEGDEYLIFAYEDAKLLALLSEKGIALHQVVGISFAQSSLKERNKAFLINEKQVITEQNGIVVVLPASWFKDARKLQESDLVASSKTIRLEQFSHIVDKKTLYQIVFLLFLFIVAISVEYFYFLQQKERIESEKSRLFQVYKLKPTLMQNSAILQSYKRRDAKEQKLRAYMIDFLKTDLAKGEKILSITYDGNKLIVLFSGVKRGEEKALLSSFYRKKIPIETKFQSDNLVVEVAL